MALQKFLCFDLRTGILALSIFNLISSLFAAVVHFVLSLDDTDPNDATANTFYLVIDILNIILNGSLAYGANKGARGFLLPFLIFGGLILSLGTLLCVVFVVFAPVLILLLILIVFHWYYWYAILCLYQSLDPRNPNYVPEKMPATVVYVEDVKPPAYYENNGADAV